MTAAPAASPDATRLVDPAAIAARIQAVEQHFAKKSPYLLAESARKDFGRDGDKECTYGVTPARVTIGLLREVGVRPDDVYVDLGCGVGHTVLVASLFCARAIGVELLPRLHAAAEEAREALGIANATFLRADMRDVDLRDASIVFAYSTCFGEPLRGVMAERIAAARPGARVVMVTHGVEHPRIEEERAADWLWATGEPGGSSTTHRVLFFRVRPPEGVPGPAEPGPAAASAPSPRDG